MCKNTGLLILFLGHSRGYSWLIFSLTNTKHTETCLRTFFVHTKSVELWNTRTDGDLTILQNFDFALENIYFRRKLTKQLYNTVSTAWPWFATMWLQRRMWFLSCGFFISYTIFVRNLICNYWALSRVRPWWNCYRQKMNNAILVYLFSELFFLQWCF